MIKNLNIIFLIKYLKLMNGCKQNLMLTSNYFAKRLSDTASADDQVVQILDVAPKIFSLMLRYFKMG